MRPGRLEEHIALSLPSCAQRQAYILHLLHSQQQQVPADSMAETSELDLSGSGLSDRMAECAVVCSRTTEGRYVHFTCILYTIYTSLFLYFWYYCYYYYYHYYCCYYYYYYYYCYYHYYTIDRTHTYKHCTRKPTSPTPGGYYPAGRV